MLLQVCPAASQAKGKRQQCLGLCCSFQAVRVKLDFSPVRLSAACWGLLAGPRLWVFWFFFFFLKKEFDKHQSIEAVGRRWRNLPIHLGNTWFDKCLGWKKGMELWGALCRASRGGWFQPDPCTTPCPTDAVIGSKSESPASFCLTVRCCISELGLKIVQLHLARGINDQK